MCGRFSSHKNRFTFIALSSSQNSLGRTLMEASPGVSPGTTHDTGRLGSKAKRGRGRVPGSSVPSRGTSADLHAVWAGS